MHVSLRGVREPLGADDIAEGTFELGDRRHHRLNLCGAGRHALFGVAATARRYEHTIRYAGADCETRTLNRREVTRAAVADARRECDVVQAEVQNKFLNASVGQVVRHNGIYVGRLETSVLESCQRRLKMEIEG